MALTAPLVVSESAKSVFARHQLSEADFDVLSTLRRSGSPYVLTPSQLSSALMMSRTGMTNRLDRLEGRGLIERTLDPADRRSFRITLTQRGLALIDRVVMNMFHEGAERNKALGLWGGIGASGATVGLLAGGALTRYAGWQYIFYLNVAIGAVVLVLARRVVPESRLSGARRRYDPLGALTVTGGLVALVYAISQAPVAGWTAARALALLGAAAALLAAFPLIELRAEAPLLPLRLAAGMTLVGAGILWATQVPAHATFWANLAGPLFITGAVTWAFIPVSIGALAGVTERDAGVASGLIDTSQQLGGAIGIAIASTVAAAHSRVLTRQGHEVAVALTGGFHWALWVAGFTALAAVPVAFLLVRRAELARTAAVTTQRDAAGGSGVGPRASTDP